MKKLLATILLIIFLALVCPAVAEESEPASDSDEEDAEESENKENPGGKALSPTTPDGTCLTAPGLTEEEIKTMRQFCKEYAEEKRKRKESLANQNKNRVPVEFLEVRTIFDNDIFIHNVSGGDRGYTNGMRLEALGQIPTEIGSKFYELRDRTKSPILGWFLQLVDSGDEIGHPRIGAAVGQEIYTPKDLKSRDIIHDDRPYAGWLYVGGMFELVGPTGRLLFEADIGATGSWSLAENFQSYVHEHTSSKYPRGWNHQTSEGIGFDTKLTGEYLLTNFESPKPHGVPLQLGDSMVYIKTNLGTFRTAAAIGWKIRMGYIKQQWLKPIAPGEFVHDRRIPKTFHHFGTDMTQIYVFFRLQSAFVLYDATIQGLPFIENEHTVSIQPIVHEGESGITLQPFNLIDIVFSAIHRTQETRIGAVDYGGHTWGHLQCGFHFY